MHRNDTRHWPSGTPHPAHGRRWACAAMLAAALALPAQAAKPGETAPAVSLPGLNGQTVDLTTYKGKVVVLDFWASWCGPCKQSFPWLNQMQARHGARGLQVLAVSVDRRRADADAFLAQVPANFVVSFDAAGETARRYAIAGMPSTVLIGADGRVLLQHSGFRDDDKPALEAAITAALAQAGTAARP